MSSLRSSVRPLLYFGGLHESKDIKWFNLTLFLCSFSIQKVPKNILCSLTSNSYHSVQFSSVAQSYLSLCNPMDCSTPGFPVRHQLKELAQTHVHWDSDAIQPSHPLSFPSPPSFNLSQHQGLFQWVSFCNYYNCCSIITHSFYSNKCYRY